MFPGKKSIAIAILTSVLAASPSAGRGQIVISQIYGGGGNSGAPFHNDFIELFNRGTNTVSVDGWFMQYASGANGTWRTTSLAGSIPPGGHYLIQQAAGSGSGVELPAADAFGDINLSATSGKVALTTNSTALSDSCPAGVVDFVGYGGANCFEGSGPAPAPSNTASALRAANGCADTDDNAADFVTSPPGPRNSATSLDSCADAPISRAVHEIQGTGPVSPFTGQFTVTTTNVVTGLRNNGFFIQAPDSEADDEPSSSEGIFVFTGTTLPSVAVIGNAVVVSGVVTEFRPASNSNSSPRTQINFQSAALISGGQPLPNPTILTPAELNPAGPLDQLERFEGMRVRVETLTATGPTEGFIDETDAMAFSTGVFFGVVNGVPRPFREPGISLHEPLPPNAPCCAPRFDTNPERLRVDANAQPGTFSREVTAGAVISNLVGVVDFEAGDYALLPEAGTPFTISGLLSASPVPAAAANEFTVASLNCRRFFDTINDPLTDDPVLTVEAFNQRLQKLSLAIRTVLRTPDILALLEVENLAVLQSIATQVNIDALASGSETPNYLAWLFEGNDPGGIDSGFLVKLARVTIREVQQVAGSATYLNPNTGQLDILHDRPPLLLRAALARTDSTDILPCTVVANHLRSLLDIDDPIDGNRVRAKRRAQAESVAQMVQSLQAANPTERIILVGDYNAYQFNDGYVDVMGTIKGEPAPSNEVVLASADLVEPNLVDLVETLPAAERYSYVIAGHAQTLDHILVNAITWPRVARFAFARLSADFPETYGNNAARLERVSDHDAPVAYISLSAVPARILSLKRVGFTQWRLEFTGEPGGAYRVESSRDLVTWEPVGSAAPLGGDKFDFTDGSASPSDHRFYRVVQ